MKKEELLELGISEEIAKKVLAINGKDIEKHKGLVDKEKQVSEKLKDELDGVKEQLTGANATIEEFKGMDIEGMKKAADEWKTKYETDTQALNDKMAKKDYEYSVKDYLNKFDFVSDFTKKAFMQEFNSKEFKLEDGKFLGADDFIKEFREANTGVFKEELKPSEPEKPNAPYTYSPNGGGDGQGDLASQVNAMLGL